MMKLYRFDGKTISNTNEAITGKMVGDKIRVTVKRYGQVFSYNITLQRNPSVQYKLVKFENTTNEQDELYRKWLYIK